ncbi:MAG TPA: hypothetical protein QGF95_27325 [Candidatus Latescibacteria bacterium]|jgi:hypothetical protein|nr:hypothetical protein [Candidatus Latescibacterota bacterium]HJP34276.1 hypothetical protein [Candidatus Latescibacterota bacterium]
MNRTEDTDATPRPVDREALRRSIRHPYITRQNPAPDAAGDGQGETPDSRESGLSPNRR